MKDIRFARFLVALNGLVPVSLLSIDALRNQLGAHPVNFAIRTTGMLSLVFLFLSLTTTPVGRITGLAWLTNFRRTLGLYAFFHALLHFGLFLTFDRALSIRSTISEMFIRPYLTVGAFSLLLMVPLAITSTNRMIKRMGARNWKRLHKLSYVAAIAGVCHYYMLVKADVRQPLAFAAVLGLLLGFRVVIAIMKNRSRQNGRPQTAVSTAMPSP